MSCCQNSEWLNEQNCSVPGCKTLAKYFSYKDFKDNLGFDNETIKGYSCQDLYSMVYASDAANKLHETGNKNGYDADAINALLLFYTAQLVKDTCSGSMKPPLVVPGKPVKPGGDADSHGCRPSAGYAWCPRENQCVRPWELGQKLFAQQAMQYCNSQPITQGAKTGDGKNNDIFHSKNLWWIVAAVLVVVIIIVLLVMFFKKQKRSRN